MEALLHLAPVFINYFPSLASGDIYFRMLAHNDVEIWSNIPVEVFPRNWSPKRKPPQLLFWSCWLFMKFSTILTSLDFYTVFDSSLREVIHDVRYNLPWITFTLYINGMRLGSFTPWRGCVRSMEHVFWDWSPNKLSSWLHHAFSLWIRVIEDYTACGMKMSVTHFSVHK